MFFSLCLFLFLSLCQETDIKGESGKTTLGNTPEGEGEGQQVSFGCFRLHGIRGSRAYGLQVEFGAGDEGGACPTAPRYPMAPR